jgi:hypothetical protein
VIEGIVVMRKGESASEVLEKIRAKVEELNSTILPDDVKIDTFYDRTNLMEFCTETVIHNLLEGIRSGDLYRVFVHGRLENNGDGFNHYTLGFVVCLYLYAFERDRVLTSSQWEPLILVSS